MSCDHELANERTRCSGKNASYITMFIVTSSAVLSKWVKWNIRVRNDVVFLRLSLLWGFSKDILSGISGYQCNATLLLWVLIYLCSSIDRDVCLWNCIFHPSNRCYCTPSFERKHLAVRNKQKRFWLNSLAHVSDIFVFRFAKSKLWPTTETLSPQIFSITPAVVAINSTFWVRFWKPALS